MSISTETARPPGHAAYSGPAVLTLVGGSAGFGALNAPAQALPVLAGLDRLGLVCWAIAVLSLTAGGTGLIRAWIRARIPTDQRWDSTRRAAGAPRSIPMWATPAIAAMMLALATSVAALATSLEQHLTVPAVVFALSTALIAGANTWVITRVRAACGAAARYEPRVDHAAIGAEGYDAIAAIADEGFPDDLDKLHRARAAVADDPQWRASRDRVMAVLAGREHDRDRLAEITKISHAMGDLVVALLVRDQISVADFQALAGPWQQAGLYIPHGPAVPVALFTIELLGDRGGWVIVQHARRFRPGSALPLQVHAQRLADMLHLTRRPDPGRRWRVTMWPIDHSSPVVHAEHGGPPQAITRGRHHH